PETGALRSVMRRRLRARGVLMLGTRDLGRWDRMRTVYVTARRRRRVTAVHGARVRQLRSGRNGNEPESDEQGRDTAPPRAMHMPQDMIWSHPCHSPLDLTGRKNLPGHTFS